MKEKRYVGIDQDPQGAMNPTGNIIRDAWMFGLLPETETCAGWTNGAISALYEKVSAEWDKYGHLVSKLPTELRERHARIYGAAVARAREQGWDPEQGLRDED